MNVDEKLLKAAVKLVEVAHKQLDSAMPPRLVRIVKTHAALCVGAAWIPIPGVDIAASAAAVWGMYYRINGELEMPFGENVVKSVASGVGTNLAAGVGVITVAAGLKFIPGVGTLAGAVMMAAAAYALTLASGYVYMNVLALLLSKKSADKITEEDFAACLNEVMSDKESVQSFVDEARKSYKKQDVMVEGMQALAEPPIEANADANPAFATNTSVEQPPAMAERPAPSALSPATDDGMVRFLCPECGKRVKVPRGNEGRRGTCRSCGSKVIVPNKPLSHREIAEHSRGRQASTQPPRQKQVPEQHLTVGALAMTEADWNRCTDPQRMLEFLRGRVSNRKLRLFACACCRRFWHRSTDANCHRAVEVAERYADGGSSDAELAEARATGFSNIIAAAASQASNRNVHLAAASSLRLDSCDAACETVRYSTGGRHQQSDILRHVIGNPFRPYPAPASWPPLVVQLASAMYDGSDCSFVLHSALLEPGHPELAEHFNGEQWHPKGCWVLDLILGKS